MNTPLLLGVSLLLATAMAGAMAAEQDALSTDAEPSHFQPHADSTGGRSQSHGGLAIGTSANALTGGARPGDDTPTGDRFERARNTSAHLVPHAGRWSDQRSTT